MIKNKIKIDEALTRGVSEIYPSKKVLEKKMLSGERLRIYQGFDPSMPSLHLGNLAGVIKLSQFQELGHEIIFLIGDFTAMIGDPTDKSDTRPCLTRKQTLQNSKNWQKQISKVLSFSGKNKAKIKFNSEWLDKISIKDLIGITSNFTVQQMLQRDFFQKRIEAKKAIHLHEFLYPVAQALDSVKMEVDLEIGGTDQTFNMLCGRTLEKKLLNKEKFVLTINLLVDKEGKKIGKTTGNAVFLDMKPEEIYGKIMSLPDETIIPGFELLSKKPMKDIGHLEKKLKKGMNPMQAKKELAFSVTALIYGEKDAQKAEKEFERVFAQDKEPENMPEIKVSAKKIGILDLLLKINLVESKSEAKRMVEQDAVKIDGKHIKDWKKEIKIKSGMVVQIGKKRFARVHNS